MNNAIKIFFLLTLTVPLVSPYTAFAMIGGIAHDTTTVLCLTEEEVDEFHRIYNGRDECYDHFLRAVEFVRYWRELHQQLDVNHRMINRLLARYQMDEVDYETALQLSADDLSALQKALYKCQKKLKRRNVWIYILAGTTLAETLTLVALFAIP